MKNPIKSLKAKLKTNPELYVLGGFFAAVTTVYAVYAVKQHESYVEFLEDGNGQLTQALKEMDELFRSQL